MSSITEGLLSKSEKEVYVYIKNKTADGKKKLKESMKTIGKNLGSSEATVHRAISKLVGHGILVVTSSSDKSESNTIQFFGEPSSPEHLAEEPFFDMISELNQRAERFKNIVTTYQNQYEEIMLENKILKNKIASLEGGSKVEGDSETEEEFVPSITFKGHSITPESIVDVEELNEEYVAFIVKKLN